MHRRTFVAMSLRLVTLLFPAAGYASGACPSATHEDLYCAFGVEVRTAGGDTATSERWILHCGRLRGSVTCELTTTQLLAFPGNCASVDVRYTTPGGLVLRDDNWMKGRLLFDVVRENGARVLVSMKFANDGADRPIDLVEFVGSGVERGPQGDAFAVELRVPEYTTTLHVPVMLPGLRSAEERRDDDVRRLLEPEDQDAYERLVRSSCWHIGIVNAAFQSFLRKTLYTSCPQARPLIENPENAAKPTAQQLRCIADATITSAQAWTRQCVAESGLSRRGQNRVLESLPRDGADLATVAQAIRKTFAQ